MTGWKIKEVILLSDEWSEAFTAQFVKRRKRLLSRSKRPHLNSIEIVTRPRLLWRYQANMVPMGCQSFHQGLRILLCVGCSNLNHDLSLRRFFLDSLHRGGWSGGRSCRGGPLGGEDAEVGDTLVGFKSCSITAGVCDLEFDVAPESELSSG